MSSTNTTNNTPNQGSDESRGLKIGTLVQLNAEVIVPGKKYDPTQQHPLKFPHTIMASDMGVSLQILSRTEPVTFSDPELNGTTDKQHYRLAGTIGEVCCYFYPVVTSSFARTISHALLLPVNEKTNIAGRNSPSNEPYTDSAIVIYNGNDSFTCREGGRSYTVAKGTRVSIFGPPVSYTGGVRTTAVAAFYHFCLVEVKPVYYMWKASILLPRNKFTTANV